MKVCEINDFVHLIITYHSYSRRSQYNMSALLICFNFIEEESYCMEVERKLAGDKISWFIFVLFMTLYIDVNCYHVNILDIHLRKYLRNVYIPS